MNELVIIMAVAVILGGIFTLGFGIVSLIWIQANVYIRHKFK